MPLIEYDVMGVLRATGTIGATGLGRGGNHAAPFRIEHKCAGGVTPEVP